MQGCDPVAVARALCARAASDRVYVADLDAIAGAPVAVETLRALSAVAGLWVDAGATDAAAAAAIAASGAARNVVGTESIDSAPEPGDVSRAVPLVLSVDLHDGALISPLPELAGRSPAAAVPLARALGVGEVVVIDLARVGSSGGPPLAAVAELVAALPGVDVYAGGGVRDDDDLRALRDVGAAGALVATALHAGTITP